MPKGEASPSTQVNLEALHLLELAIQNQSSPEALKDLESTKPAKKRRKKNPEKELQKTHDRLITQLNRMPNRTEFPTDIHIHVSGLLSQYAPLGSQLTENIPATNYHIHSSTDTVIYWTRETQSRFTPSKLRFVPCNKYTERERYLINWMCSKTFMHEMVELKLLDAAYERIEKQYKGIRQIWIIQGRIDKKLAQETLFRMQLDHKCLIISTKDAKDSAQWIVQITRDLGRIKFQ